MIVLKEVCNIEFSMDFETLAQLIIQSESLTTEEIGDFKKYVDKLVYAMVRMAKIHPVFDYVYHLKETHKLIGLDGNFSCNLKETTSIHSNERIIYPRFLTTKIIDNTFLYIQDLYNAHRITATEILILIILLHPFGDGNGRMGKLIHIWGDKDRFPNYFNFRSSLETLISNIDIDKHIVCAEEGVQLVNKIIKEAREIKKRRNDLFLNI